MTTRNHFSALNDEYTEPNDSYKVNRNYQKKMKQVHKLIEKQKNGYKLSQEETNKINEYTQKENKNQQKILKELAEREKEKEKREEKRRKKEEARRRKEEARRQQEEARRQQEEARRQEEEARRQEEEAKRDLKKPLNKSNEYIELYYACKKEFNNHDNILRNVIDKWLETYHKNNNNHTKTYKDLSKMFHPDKSTDKQIATIQQQMVNSIINRYRQDTDN
jgi:hypothetical protein